MGRALLETHFAYAGALIFALSVLMAGLLLSTDYFMFRAAAVTTSVTGRTLMQVGHFGHTPRRQTEPAEIGSRRRGRARRGRRPEAAYDEEDEEEDRRTKRKRMNSTRTRRR